MTNPLQGSDEETQERIAQVRARLSAATPGPQTAEGCAIFPAWKIESASSVAWLVLIADRPAHAVSARPTSSGLGVRPIPERPSSSGNSGESGDENATQDTKRADIASSEETARSTTESSSGNAPDGYGMAQSPRENFANSTPLCADVVSTATSRSAPRDSIPAILADSITSCLEVAAANTGLKIWSCAAADVTPSSQGADLAFLLSRVDSLESALREAQKDAERIDYLQERRSAGHSIAFATSLDALMVAAQQTNVWDRNGNIRNSIDAARADTGEST